MKNEENDPAGDPHSDPGTVRNDSAEVNGHSHEVKIMELALRFMSKHEYLLRRLAE
jgi:hypothetical protein